MLNLKVSCHFGVQANLSLETQSHKRVFCLNFYFVVQEVFQPVHPLVELLCNAFSFGGVFCNNSRVLNILTLFDICP